MQVSEILYQSNIFINIQVKDKKQLLELVSNFLSQNLTNVTPNQIFDLLHAREKLGNTSIGNGVAIPHGTCKEISVPIAIFVRLKEPINFDSTDNQPVDLFFCLLIPAVEKEQNLEILTTVTEKFTSKLIQKIRDAKDTKAIYKLITQN